MDFENKDNQPIEEVDNFEDVAVAETEEENEQSQEQNEQEKRELHVVGEGKAFLTELLQLMKCGCTIEERPKRDELCYFLKGEDARAIIGYRGETLDAIQHLTTQVAKNTGSTYERVVIDADFYRQKKEKRLIFLAQTKAKKAAQTGMVIHLDAMTATERRIVHSALQDSTYATTHSEGEGRDRHVVLVPLEQPITDTVDDYSAIPDSMYGSTDFSKRGPRKTRSFGAKKRRF